MKKVAGRLKIELSQYRDLEAFAQFGSDLDPETQRTLARGERLVKALNQNERSPLPVAVQVVQVYAGTNGYLDRIDADRVTEFLEALTQRLHSESGDLLEKIAGGDWSDDTQAAVKKFVSEFASDFGYDLDEEGQPTDEGDDDAPKRGEQSESGNGASASSSDDDEDSSETSEATEEQTEAAPA
jgi:F-type H+-transporting ATPase subunit alpha